MLIKSFYMKVEAGTDFKVVAFYSPLMSVCLSVIEQINPHLVVFPDILYRKCVIKSVDRIQVR
jgi:hypothetical protein